MKVKELKRLYKEAGYRFKRSGKGDHEIWEDARGDVQVFDGRDNDDVGKGLARAMLRRLESRRE